MLFILVSVPKQICNVYLCVDFKGQQGFLTHYIWVYTLIKVHTNPGSTDVSVCLSLCKEAGALISIFKAVIVPSLHQQLIICIQTSLHSFRESPTGSRRPLSTPLPPPTAEMSRQLDILQIPVFTTWTACAKCLSTGCFIGCNCVFCAKGVSFKVRCVYGPSYYKTKRCWRCGDGGSALRPWQEKIYMKCASEQGYFQAFSL